MVGNHPQKVKITGISLPENIIKIIDENRGDINRSRYILRLIEKSIPVGSTLPGSSQQVQIH